ncbi:hypothetical protein [Methylobacterium sp. PvR107]|uniref:hypothetical protein n=1 Tax=Methylobacterium sp. PvR107 TaxID=2806597 RepID=UPI001AEB7323|nr:hypothetical protein [Methylobacterium sp. PvR107]MBP1182710.1 hypothetical protein [Methylobacterium sp. PvR107]
MKSATFALLAVAAGAVPALAETSAERAACTPEVLRLCAAQMPNAGAITACLRERRATLGPGCRTVMAESAAPVRSVTARR